MRKIILSSFIILSCAAAQAQADVITSDGAVIVNSRYLNDDNNSRSFYRHYPNGRDNVVIMNGRDSGAVIMQDGKTVYSKDGSYNLKDGKIDIKDGRVNGRVGGVEIRN